MTADVAVHSAAHRDGPGMRILIVSWYFPPVNAIGAVRVGKFTRYLVERGHEVGVVAGRDWGMPETMPLGIELKRLSYSNWFDVNAPVRLGSGLWTRMTGQPPASLAETAAPQAETGAADNGTSRPALLRRLSDCYTNLLNIPDQRVGWYPYALRDVLRLGRAWRPDAIYASGPSFTAFLVAHRASARLGVPWLAELRDRWADDPYRFLDWPRWRHRLEQWVERRTLRNATGIVTVTEPWCEFYRAKYGKPVATVYNGYDPKDFSFDPSAPPKSVSAKVRIVYTGAIYVGRRDPTPLFQALRQIDPEGERFVLEFYGTAPEAVWPLAERAGVRHLVEVHPAVPYDKSLQLQWDADVLLLMQWDNPMETGNCPGKLFEYLASLRPILVMGYDKGVPADFVRARRAGAVSTDPDVIAGHLRDWAREKAAQGVIPRLPVAAREGLARDLQFARAEAFLERPYRGRRYAGAHRYDVVRTPVATRRHRRPSRVPRGDPGHGPRDGQGHRLDCRRAARRRRGSGCSARSFWRDCSSRPISASSRSPLPFPGPFRR